MNKETMPKNQMLPKLRVAEVINRFFKKSQKTIEVDIPKGFFNCGVTTTNRFVSDTNDSKNWDTLSFPLPKPKYRWKIKCYHGNMNDPDKKSVTLIDAL